MTVIEHAPGRETILDAINDALRNLREAGADAHAIIVGTEAYDTLRHAMAERFRRSPGYFETYQHIPIVVDPFRTTAVCVLPAPEECAKGVHAVRLQDL